MDHVDAIDDEDASSGLPRRWLTVEPLCADSFAAFGDVIEADGVATRRTINDGFKTRFDDLARLDTCRDGGRPVLSLFRALPHALPLRLRCVDRHRLGSQAFVPLLPQRFLVVVAPPGPAPAADVLRCFLAAAGQGVNDAARTRHHPLIAIDDGGDFIVIDRGGPGAETDCDVSSLADGALLAASSSLTTPRRRPARCDGMDSHRDGGRGSTVGR